jgi:hypothetical protein
VTCCPASKPQLQRFGAGASRQASGLGVIALSLSFFTRSSGSSVLVRALGLPSGGGNIDRGSCFAGHDALLGIHHVVELEVTQHLAEVIRG